MNLKKSRQPNSDGADTATAQEYAFEVKFVAVVRVCAPDEALARKVVPAVLGSPGTAEIELVNETNHALGLSATVTGVDFFAKGDSAVLLKDKKDKQRA